MIVLLYNVSLILVKKSYKRSECYEQNYRKLSKIFIKRSIQLKRLDTETAFEHFTNKCIVNKYSNERFDPSDIMTDPGEKGLDGVANMCKWTG